MDDENKSHLLDDKDLFVHCVEVIQQFGDGLNKHSTEPLSPTSSKWTNTIKIVGWVKESTYHLMLVISNSQFDMKNKIHFSFNK